MPGLSPVSFPMRNELLEPLLKATEIGLGGEIGERSGRQA